MVVCTFLLTLFASIGFLSPANRGSIIIGKFLRLNISISFL